MRIYISTLIAMIWTAAGLAQDSLDVRFVGQCTIPGGWAEDVALSGNIAIVTDFYKGVRIIDVSTPQNPVEIATLDTTMVTSGVIISGNYAYVIYPNAGMFKIIDISSPASPSIIGSASWNGNPAASPKDIVMRDTLVFITDHFFGLRIYNVSNPSAPSLVCTCAVSNGYTGDVGLFGDYAYVSMWTDGLSIIDISDVHYPFVVDTVLSEYPAGSIEVNDSHLYLGCDTSGLRVFDISTPLSPSMLGYCDTPGNLTDIACQGSLLYVCDGWSGFRVLNGSMPSSIEEIGFYYNGSWFSSSVESNGFIYAASGPGGLCVLEYYGPSGICTPEPTTAIPPQSTLKATPNPFSSSIDITCALGQENVTEAAIYDLNGRRIKGISCRSIEGQTKMTWHGKDDQGLNTAPGIYFVRIKTDRGGVTGRIVKIR